MKMTHDEILKKVMHYCAYQERSVSEARIKIDSFETTDAIKEKIMNTLIEEGVVDDVRFAECYVKSKLHLKKWGVNKIKMQLKKKGIDEITIDNAISGIDRDSYRNELEKILKAKTINESDPYKKGAKLVQYGIQKGYEPDLVWEIVNEMI